MKFRVETSNSKFQIEMKNNAPPRSVLANVLGCLRTYARDQEVDWAELLVGELKHERRVQGLDEFAKQVDAETDRVDFMAAIGSAIGAECESQIDESSKTVEEVSVQVMDLAFGRLRHKILNPGLADSDRQVYRRANFVSAFLERLNNDTDTVALIGSWQIAPDFPIAKAI